MTGRKISIAIEYKRTLAGATKKISDQNKAIKELRAIIGALTEENQSLKRQLAQNPHGEYARET